MLFLHIGDHSIFNSGDSQMERPMLTTPLHSKLVCVLLPCTPFFRDILQCNNSNASQIFLILQSPSIIVLDIKISGIYGPKILLTEAMSYYKIHNCNIPIECNIHIEFPLNEKIFQMKTKNIVITM